MKRFLISILCLVLMTSLLVGCAGTPAASTTAPATEPSSTTAGDSGSKETDGEQIVMRLAHINPETDPKHQEALKFAELVNQKTNGKVKVDVYGGGVLGDVREIIEGLQLGTNEIVIEGFGTIGSYTKLSYLDLVPYLYRDYDHFMNTWNGAIGKEILQASGQESSMKLFGPSYRGVRVTTSTKKFTNLEELKGLKIRVPSDDVSVSTWQALGTTPTPMAMTEVLTGLEQKTVEAQENPCILSYTFGLSKVCDYLIKTNHRWSADMFMMDQKYFEALSPEIQTAIIEAGNEAAEYVSQVIVDSENEYYQKWQADGVEIVEPDLTEFKKACEGLVDKQFPELVDYVDKIQSVQ